MTTRRDARARELLAAAERLRTTRPDSAIRLYRALTREEPELAEAWSGIGVLALQYGALLGIPRDSARAALERAAQHGDSAALLQLRARTLPSDSSLRALRESPDSSIALHAQTLLALREAGSGSGSFREAAALFRMSEPRAIEVVTLRLALAPTRRAPELRALAARLATFPAEPHDTAAPARRTLLRGLLLAKAGAARDRRHAGRLADSLAARPRLARILRAELALAAGDARGALRQLGAPTVEARDSALPLMSWPRAHERWVRARAHSALGRRAEAAAWLDGFRAPAGYDLPYAAAADSARVRR